RFFSDKIPGNEEKLHIAVYTSLENWEKEQEQFPFDFSLPGGHVPFDPQDRRILCDAMFFREGDGDFAPAADNEWYWFSPDLNSPNVTKTVVLKGTVRTKTPSGYRPWTANATQRPDGSFAVIAAQTVSANSVFINSWGPFVNQTILVTTNSGSTSVTFSFGTNLSGKAFQALILLHELGHQAGVFQPDAQDSQLNAAQTQQVYDACFK
ncbi:MAG: hypothetical protein WAV20_05205, partial [Blastocatellia bacterium]